MMATTYLSVVTISRHVGDDIAPDVLDLLQSRLDIVETVESEPVQKPDLDGELDVSRSTIDRAVKELETAGIVTRGEKGYELTLFGYLLADQYRTQLDRIRQLVRAGPLLDALPADVPMSVDFVQDASIYHASSPAVLRPIDRFEDLIRDATTLHGLSRTISQSSTSRLLEEQVRDGRLDCELVMTRALREYLAEERSRTERALYETGCYRVYETDSLPYGLALFDLDEDDTTAMLFVYGESNGLLGTIVNDEPPAVEWATTVYERFRADATEVSYRLGSE